MNVLAYIKKIAPVAASALILTSCGRAGASTSVVGDFAEEYVTSSAEEKTVSETVNGELTGLVREAGEHTLRISTPGNNSQYHIAFNDEVSLEDINIGDTVKVTYSGEILEIYPSSVMGGDSVKVITKTDKEYISVEQVLSTHTVSFLIPADWKITETDYPTFADNDEETDLGINLSPEGSDGYITISWHSTISGIDSNMNARAITVDAQKAFEYTSKNSDIWSLILFNDINDMAINNFFTDSKDWDKYSEDTDFILSTLDIY